MVAKKVGEKIVKKIIKKIKPKIVSKTKPKIKIVSKTKPKTKTKPKPKRGKRTTTPKTKKTTPMAPGVGPSGIVFPSVAAAPTSPLSGKGIAGALTGVGAVVGASEGVRRKRRYTKPGYR
tara:strand:+ start:954 stop:1313 length:360 start_codon:yes stop_codon:yes gene_type:complete